MKQETLEEAAERFTPQSDKWTIKEIFIEGAKWMQERSYSEKEVIKFGQYLTEFDNLNNENEYVVKQLLEQFKKK